MTVKELLLKEIESLPDSLLTETLEFVQGLKSKKSENTDSSSPVSGGSILQHAGKWVGDDFEECLDLVYASRGQAKF